MATFDHPFRIGTLTPSSNTVLEPMSILIAGALPDVTLHFSRFPVLSISTKEDALGQFKSEPMLHAARLLGDAKMDRIVWSGTSSGWLGMDADYELCRAVEAATGIPTTTSVIALFEAFRATPATRIGLVTPYLDSVQKLIVETFRKEGFETVGEEHKSYEDNFSFATVSEENLKEMIRRVAEKKPEAITVFCTNLRGQAVVAEMEQETGIPIYDTVATALWQVLAEAKIDMSPIAHNGSIFSLPR